MKKLAIGIVAVLALSSSAFAEADMEWKGGSNANGSQVGFNSSQNTGNGGPIGGHGTINGGGTHDDTTYPGSRSDAVQGLHEAEGRGRSNSNDAGHNFNGGRNSR